ncbi:hypothetical protein SERLA73DRAFT_73996 [Serpula lacrymans var. lacrymans S7.3]|uniref:C2 domain-containing protein n=1 Tax=Serpula lacrymans var. lacrymans (strain S7.3) TaxID=936435 RepID=F8PXE4_SERL3|nr:hypothetical protein SERLA73DRAFT_73996 [Serpula lacrymans var. lacrymans S7.3]
MENHSACGLQPTSSLIEDLDASEGVTVTLTVVKLTHLADLVSCQLHVTIDLDGCELVQTICSDGIGDPTWGEVFHLTMTCSSILQFSIFSHFSKAFSIREHGPVGKVYATVEELLYLCKDNHETSLPIQVVSGSGKLCNGYLVVAVTQAASTSIDEENLTRSELSQNFYVFPLALSLRAVMDRSQMLTALGEAYQARFKYRKDVCGIDLTLKCHKKALDIRPLGHARRLESLCHLATAHLFRFEELSDAADLSATICYLTEALVLQSVDSPHRPKLSSDLGTAFMARYQHSRDTTDLDMAIQYHLEVLAIRPPGHRQHLKSLMKLEQAYADKHEASGNLADLDFSIEYHRQAVEHALERAQRLSESQYRTIRAVRDLADIYVTRFESTSDLHHLNMATKYRQKALDLMPQTHLFRYALIRDFVTTCWIRFKHCKDSSSLDLAINLSHEAVTMCAPGHIYHLWALRDLADSYMLKYNQYGGAGDLDSAIDYRVKVLEFVSTEELSFSEPRDDHSRIGGELSASDFTLPPMELDRHFYLGSLANSLQKRFELCGDLSDLQMAFQYFQEALGLCPPEHPDRPDVLNGIGTAFWARYERWDDIKDMEQAIAYHSEALSITSPGDPHHRHGDFSDLDISIDYRRKALKLCAVADDERFISLINLGSALYHRFQLRGDSEDLEQAIQCYTEGLASSMGQLDRHSFLVNLANSFQSQFGLTGNPSDLETAVDFHKRSLELVPPGHINYAPSLNNYANALLTRFEQYGRSGDGIQSAVGRSTTSPSGFRHGTNVLESPNLFHIYDALISAHLTRYTAFKRMGRQTTDLDDAFKNYNYATNHPFYDSWRRLELSLGWIINSEKHKHTSRLDAYKTSLSLLDRHTAVDPSLESRLHIIKSAPASLASDAAACAMGESRIELAVELLEQGRAVVWAQLARFRTSLHRLRETSEHGQELAARFQLLSSQMEHQRALPERVRMSSQISLEEEARNYRRLSKEWDAVVQQIREVDGFAHFLKPVPFSDLHPVADNGPVVIVNISQYRCDAIIILKASPPRLINLSPLTLGDISEMSSQFADILKGTSHVGEEKMREKLIIPVLRRLWYLIIQPVVNEIKDLVPKGSRIWWCPTSRLTFLPLHAAGAYRKGEHNLANLFISSYTPTLSALLRSREVQRNAATLPRFLAIGQAKPSEASHESELKFIGLELNLIKSLVPPVMCLALSKQDLSQPFDSSFALRDKPLRLLDIAHANLSNPEFAFLSACHTAAGDATAPDEAIHLAAVIQFSGFRALSERCGLDGSVDYTGAAKALNKATKMVDKDEVPLDQRIVFIHVGA